MDELFEKFTKGDFLLEIWNADKNIFQSKERGVKGLLEFIKTKENNFNNLIVFDTKIGNAAALLCVYIKAKKVYSVIGSSVAEETLKKYGIEFYFQKIIPNILNKEETDICPLEKLSFSKTPEEFLNCLEK